MSITPLVALLSSTAHAGITQYTDRDAWFSAVGGESAVTTIGFTGFANDTPITDQYEDHGIIFSAGFARGPGCLIYPNDCWGLAHHLDIAFEFTVPRNSLAVSHPGAIEFHLYLGDLPVGTATFDSIGGGNFSGITSTNPFDRVIMTDQLTGGAEIDDLHFVTIPIPGAIVIVLGALFPSRDRRRAIIHCSSRIVVRESHLLPATA